MNKLFEISSLVAMTSLVTTSAALAGIAPPQGAPAPLLGAGLPGLAILAVAGAGYVAVRMRRRGRD